MKYLEDVINSGIFEGIKKSNYIDAFEQLKINGRSYGRNEAIFFEGDIVDKICIVHKGSVRAEKTYASGEVHIVDVFDEGATFALEFATSRKKETAIDYISNEKSTVVFVSVHSIQRSNYAVEIKDELTYILADSNIKMSHKIKILAERGLRDRVMAYLDVLQSKSGSRTFEVKMSREQMAQFLCVNRSALSNELNKMKREKIIDFKGTSFKIL